MRMLAFSTRNRKEILRDPMSLVFGIGFPVVLIAMFSFLSKNIKDMPANIFGIGSFAPGMAVLGLSFISLFLGMLIANDRASSLLMRLFASPLTGFDYILGYSLPLLPIAMMQGAVCFLAAILFGLSISANLLVAVVVLVPVAALFIGIGLLMGICLTYGQVGGIGSLLINIAAWMSGTWFPLDMVGGAYAAIGNALPFVHAASAVKAAVGGDFAAIVPHLLWVTGYALALFTLATILFKRKMKG